MREVNSDNVEVYTSKNGRESDDRSLEVQGRALSFHEKAIAALNEALDPNFLDKKSKYAELEDLRLQLNALKENSSGDFGNLIKDIYVKIKNLRDGRHSNDFKVKLMLYEQELENRVIPLMLLKECKRRIEKFDFEWENPENCLNEDGYLENIECSIEFCLESIEQLDLRRQSIPDRALQATMKSNVISLRNKLKLVTQDVFFKIAKFQAQQFVRIFKSYNPTSSQDSSQVWEDGIYVLSDIISARARAPENQEILELEKNFISAFKERLDPSFKTNETPVQMKNTLSDFFTEGGPQVKPKYLTKVFKTLSKAKLIFSLNESENSDLKDLAFAMGDLESGLPELISEEFLSEIELTIKDFLVDFPSLGSPNFDQRQFVKMDLRALLEKSMNILKKMTIARNWQPLAESDEDVYEKINLVYDDFLKKVKKIIIEFVNIFIFRAESLCYRSAMNTLPMAIDYAKKLGVDSKTLNEFRIKLIELQSRPISYFS